MKKMKLTRNGIQYFESGGGVTSGGGSLGDVGQAIQGLAGDFTAQNNYHADLAPTEQTHYGNLINQSGLENFSGYAGAQDNVAQQNQLAKALMAQANGTGPNPALSALNQQTGQNVANQGALAAGQRGASANVGLIARQAANQGAATQQTAVGQAATLQAQQQLANQQQQAALLGQIGAQNIAQQNAASNLFGATSGAQNAQNNTNVANYGMAQGINAQVAQNNTNAVNKNNAGIVGGIASKLGFAEGGDVPNPKVAEVSGGQRFEGALDPHVEHIAKIYHPHMFADGGIASSYAPNFSNADAVKETKSGFGGGGAPSIPGTTGSPGALPGQDSSTFAGPEMAGGAGDAGGAAEAGGASELMELAPLAVAAKGGTIPGKPKVNHNAYKNDTVPAMLTPEEIVLPLSVTKSANPPEEAKKFVADQLRKKYGNSGGGDFKESLKKAISSRKVS